MRVTLAQIAPRLGRLADNLAAHRQILAEAWAGGSRLVVFPELSLTGYLLRDYTSEVALTVEELAAHLAAVAAPAGAGPLEVVLGFVELSPGRQCYNAGACFELAPDAAPRLVHLHRKVHLPTYGMFDERRYFNPGRRYQAFESPSLGRCGLLICEDLWHPSSVFVLSVDGPAFEGAGVLLGLANSPARGLTDTERFTVGNMETWRRLNALYAELYGLLVFHVQRVGVEDQYIFSGGSQILAPGGEVLLEAPLFDEAIVSAEIDPAAVLRPHRSANPRALAEDVDLVRRELERIGSAVYGAPGYHSEIDR
jgi:predicted amidohydrolase